MNEAKATRFQRRQRRVHVLAWASCGLALSAVALTPLGAWLRDVTQAFTRSWPSGLAAPANLVLFTCLVAAFVGAFAVPALALSGRDVQAGSTGPPDDVASRWLVETRIALLLLPAILAAAGLIHLAARISPDWWWVLAGLGAASALSAAMYLGPLLLSRVGEIRPVSRRSVASAIAAVADVANLRLAGVYEWHVTASGGTAALVAGLGRNRRVLVSTELTRDWSDDEIAVVVAHELGHHARHDLARAALLAALILLAAAGLAQAALVLAGSALSLPASDDLAALPFVALVVWAVWWLTTPLRLAQSRRQERQADAFALACTGEAEAFRAAIRRLAAARLAEERPSAVATWFFHRHPSVADRLALAEGFEKGRGRQAGHRP